MIHVVCDDVSQYLATYLSLFNCYQWMQVAFDSQEINMVVSLLGCIMLPRLICGDTKAKDR